MVTGPYRRVRHPLYASGMGLIFGIGLTAASWLILAWAGLGIVAVLAFIVPREERELVARFGEGYRSYQSRSGRLLPRF